MDANNTKYHLILGERDWLPLLVEQDSIDCWWDGSRQMISLAPVVRQLGELAQGVLLDISRRRGASFDHYGNVFWIDDDQAGVCYAPAATPGQSGIYWTLEQLADDDTAGRRHGDFRTATASTPASLPPVLRGLTVTAREYLVVGTLQPGGLLVFDLHAGGPPLWLHWPEPVGFQPYDLCSTPDGGIWVLSRDPGTGVAKVWYLDSGFRLREWSGDLLEWPERLGNDFYPHETLEEEGAEASADGGMRRFFAGIALNEDSPLIAENPVAIEAIGCNGFILLDSPEGAAQSSVHYFVNGRYVRTLDLDESVTGEILSQPAIHGHDFAFVPDANDSSNQRVIRGDLYVAATDAQQSWKLALLATEDSLELQLEPSLIPMRAYSGRAVVASASNAYYDFEDRWLPLAEQPQSTYVSSARLDGIVRDGEEPDCVWHRIIVDACIPQGTQVQVETRTANTQQELASAAWQQEPDLHRRTEGSELPFHEPFDADTQHAGSWDVLLQNAVGRYIELRLKLAGNRRATPRVKGCRIYYPRFSYLQRYLPAVYGDDRESASFLDRFLANVEGLYTGLEDKIARNESLFDSRVAPAEFLEWLGGWLGAVIDPSWDEDRKRLFVENAVLLFKWRGTAIGLRALLHLSTDSCPHDGIFEPLRQGRDVFADYDDFPARHLGDEIRIVEKFYTRRYPRLASSISSAGSGGELPLSAENDLWAPEQGPGPIHLDFQAFLTGTYGADISTLNEQWGQSYGSYAEILFPPLLPGDAVQQRDWLRFTRDFMQFTYAEVSADDLPRYRDFLQRRYRQVNALNTAHGRLEGSSLASFGDVQMPGNLPANTQALSDWIEFVSLALPIALEAHTFTVLLPTNLGDLPTDLEIRRAQVEQIVAMEKPSHTRFEVKYFWALFQVGSARLGIDTHIGDGSRFAGLVLGKNFLGQSYLTESHPWSVVDRTVVGRERLTSPQEWRL